MSGAEEAREELQRAKERIKHGATGLPSLHLLIWPTAQSMRLSLVMYYSVPGQRRACQVLRSADWRPAKVTQRKLVEWGQRALADWLAEHAEAELKDQPEA